MADFPNFAGLPKRLLGGTVVDFPNLAGDNSSHLKKQERRTQGSD